MHRVYKTSVGYVTTPTKCMYRLRNLKPLREKYYIEAFENKWICGYLFPDGFDMRKHGTEVNIILPEIEYDTDEDDEGYEQEYSYYFDAYIEAKDNYNYLNMFRIPEKYIKDLKVIEYFPWEDAEDNIIPNAIRYNIYGWDGDEMVHPLDWENVDNVKYY